MMRLRLTPEAPQPEAWGKWWLNPKTKFSKTIPADERMSRMTRPAFKKFLNNVLGLTMELRHSIWRQLILPPHDIPLSWFENGQITLILFPGLPALDNQWICREMFEVLLRDATLSFDWPWSRPSSPTRFGHFIQRLGPYVRWVNNICINLWDPVTERLPVFQNSMGRVNSPIFTPLMSSQLYLLEDILPLAKLVAKSRTCKIKIEINPWIGRVDFTENPNMASLAQSLVTSDARKEFSKNWAATLDIFRSNPKWSYGILENKFRSIVVTPDGILGTAFLSWKQSRRPERGDDEFPRLCRKLAVPGRVFTLEPTGRRFSFTVDATGDGVEVIEKD